MDKRGRCQWLRTDQRNQSAKGSGTLYSLYDFTRFDHNETEKQQVILDMAWRIRKAQPVLEPEAKPNGVSASAPNSAPSLQIGGSTKALEEKARKVAAYVQQFPNQAYDLILKALRAGRPDTQEQKKEERPVVTLPKGVMCKGSYALGTACKHCEKCLAEWEERNTAHEGRSESEESGENCEYCKQPLSGVENDRGDTICGKCRADIAESLE